MTQSLSTTPATWTSTSAHIKFLCDLWMMWMILRLKTSCFYLILVLELMNNHFFAQMLLRLLAE